MTQNSSQVLWGGKLGMKTTVRYDDIREFELKPGSALTTYLQLTQSDVKEYFLSGSPLSESNCPACLNSERNEAFTKFGLKYWECSHCKSLYISPRPAESTIDEYYQKSEARRFWAQQFLPETESKRREKLFKPRVQWIIDTVEEYFPSAQRVTSINDIHPPFIAELIESSYFKEINIINPKTGLKQINNEQQEVRLIEDSFEDIPTPSDAVTLFEVIDRLADVEAFFNTLEKMLVPGGLCFLTTISISGFDLQVLWEKSSSIFPPDRINVLSTEGLMLLFERHGFECIELSTPGLLDIQIVANAYKKDPQLNLPRFVKYLLENRDIDALQSFQEFLQMNRLSSFTRIAAQKK